MKEKSEKLVADANHDMRKHFYDEKLNIRVEKPNQNITEEANNELDEVFQNGEKSDEILTHKQFIP